MKKIIILILSFPLISYSQTGPGGVGSNDGTSNLEFWYMAQDENYSDGDFIDTIFDRSGNNRTLTALTTERPIFTSTTVFANNMSSMLFDGNDELETIYNGNSNENMSFGIIFNYTATGNLDIMLQHGGRNTMSINGANRYFDFVGGSAHTGSSAVTSAWAYHSKTFANSGTNRLKFYENSSNTNNFTHNIENRTSNTFIGGNGPGGGTGFVGSIAEVYKFSRVINSAESIIVANYLSAKYNITLSTNDLYDEDDLGNGDYDFDVAGIGRVDASNLHNDSQGTGIVRINNPTNLGNDEFLIWGHDNGILQATEIIDVPATVQARFDRVWRASEVNSSLVAINVGNIDISFDLTNLGSVTASDLRLLVDTDNDGVFSDETPISGASLVGGNIYQFAGVSAIANNLRFTLGTINNNQTPLPIELLNFNAKIINDEYVKLDWQTGSEINNDYFTIEKSQNGIDWKNLKTVDGAGNSSTLLNYEINDLTPNMGVSYYRLKQTDFDGEFSYSNIKSINFSLVNNKVEIFPNPTENQITITGSKSELETITIYNVLGQNITNKTIIKKLDNKVIIDLTKLSEGTYYIRTKTTANKVYKQ